jgi:casein kinase 1
LFKKIQIFFLNVFLKSLFLDGIPIMYCYGYNTNYNILIMERLGHSLDFFFKKCNKKFSLKTVCLITLQILQRLQHIHSNNLVHRDLKPENFLLGLKPEEKNKIYLIDFGLCFKYKNSSTNQHVPMRTGKSLTGTARYASINALKGCEQSRRDDLESLGYIIVYFLNGSLPWQGTRGKNLKEKFENILNKKIEIDLENLCKDLPREIKLFLEHCRKLEFTEDPDYVYLSRLIKSVIRRECPDVNIENLGNLESLQYDWDLLMSTINQENLHDSNVVITNNIKSEKNENQNQSEKKLALPLPQKSMSDNNVVNLNNINRSTVVVLNPNNQNANVTLNISQIQKKLDESEILRKKTTIVSGIIKRKTTANS